jgi:hypothetical protein
MNPRLFYCECNEMAGSRAGAGGVHVNVQHGAIAAVASGPLPFGAVAALLGALVVVVSVIAAYTRVRADIT